MKKVFISYSHDSDEHCNRVLQEQCKWTKAKKEFIKSSKILKQLVAQDSTNAVWKQDFEDVSLWLEFLDHKLANK